jgi:hypothetical protein
MLGVQRGVHLQKQIQSIVCRCTDESMMTMLDPFPILLR